MNAARDQFVSEMTAGLSAVAELSPGKEGRQTRASVMSTCLGLLNWLSVR